MKIRNDGEIGQVSTYRSKSTSSQVTAVNKENSRGVAGEKPGRNFPNQPNTANITRNGTNRNFWYAYYNHNLNPIQNQKYPVEAHFVKINGLYILNISMSRYLRPKTKNKLNSNMIWIGA